MYEYHIYNEKTGKEEIIFGYHPGDAFRRANLDHSEWTIWLTKYVD